jgi:hypothetical protein
MPCDRCSHNGGSRVPKLVEGYPTAALREFEVEFWDYRPGRVMYSD